MILAHVAGNAAGMEGHACCPLIAIHQAGGQTVGAVHIMGVERSRYFKAGRLVVDVFA